MPDKELTPCPFPLQGSSEKSSIYAEALRPPLYSPSVPLIGLLVDEMGRVPVVDHICGVRRDSYE